MLTLSLKDCEVFRDGLKLCQVCVCILQNAKINSYEIMHVSLPSLSIVQNISLPQSFVWLKAISAYCYYCVCLELLFFLA